MAKFNTAIRGTADVLPEESYKWQFVEKKLLDTARLFGVNGLSLWRLGTIPVYENWNWATQ